MNITLTKSFGAELTRIAAELKESAYWPSPGTGLARQLLNLCGRDERGIDLLGPLPFPEGPLDAAPTAAAAGFAIVMGQLRSEELSRWRDSLKRLVKRDPFPRDRQTFAYRPAELVGLTLGISITEDRGSESDIWIRSVLQTLPNKNPPTTPWPVLLYHYAAAVAGIQFSLAIPARFSEYDTTELALLIALFTHGNILKTVDVDFGAAQSVLLERIVTTPTNAREVEKLAALHGALSLSLKTRISTLTQPATQAERHHLPSPTIMKRKILFLAANPSSETRLALDKECREIENKIQASEHRDSLELLSKWAVRSGDLLQYLHQHSPHIVHFSGHGSSAEELIFLDTHEEAKPVNKAALKHLFTTLKDNIRVVVLNACFSQPQAEAITEVIDCAVGMNQAIGDEAAVTFAAAFYQAIGFGRSIKVAFESGKAALLLDGIPEENTPVLIVRAGVDPESIVLVQPKTPILNPK